MRSIMNWLTALAILIVGSATLNGPSVDQLTAAPPAVAIKPATPAQAPPIGMTFPGKILSAHDADSLIVEVRMTLHLRLDGCWAPEIDSKDPIERQIAIEGRDYIRAIGLQRDCIVSIPFHDRNNAVHMADSLTMERWLSRVWLKDEPGLPDLSTRLVQRKLAATAKKKPLGE
jgi:hypothetical protein